MSDSKNKQSSGFFSNAIGVAKKLSSTGIHAIFYDIQNQLLKTNGINQNKPRLALNGKDHLDSPPL